MRFEANFNKSWYFKKLDVNANVEQALAIPEDQWQKVTLPHDWLIYDSKNLYEDSTGWYRKWFGVYLNENKRYKINFDGIYMDSTVYVNGKLVGHNHYGYSAFEVDITEAIQEGENEILVRVCNQSPNTRWYSGAGIFRDVTYKEVPATHIATNGVYVSAKKVNDRWLVITDTEVEGPDKDRVTFDHNVQLIQTNPENAGTIAKACPEAKDYVIKDSSHGDNCSLCQHPCASRGNVRVSDVAYDGNSCTFIIDNPFVWDVESPNLYELYTSIQLDGKEIDSVVTRFGLRELEFTCDRGMILNGRRVKIQGVCEHHDLGSLGAAFNKEAMRRKIFTLKKMGVNAIRTSHNMPAKGLMELADEMGILVDSEAFDMWRHPKTTYDYARFFDEDVEKDIESWVKRDRNHPSVIMWSIGNEIYDCHGDADAPETTAMLKGLVEKHDYLHNAVATFGSNYMPWEGAQKCADVLKLAGYNYGEKCYDAHHEKYPDWMIYGSETCSTVQSRGVYHFPMSVSIMADDDEQCSTLGNCTTSWGAPNTEYVIKAERDRDYSAGQFLWSGFDYIGEPTPYHTKNSYFGQIDTAGFPKDTFYIFKGEWTDVKKAPFVHVFPYWDFNEGQLIDVRIASNANTVELICNGESLGKKSIDHEKGEELVPTWQVPYHKGYIEAVAYDEDGKEIARERRSSFGDVAELRYTKNAYLDGSRNAEWNKQLAKMMNPGISEDEIKNPEKLAFYEIYAVDKDGNEVENACSRVNVSVKNGTLIGLDNGDSTDYEQYKCSSRRMFNGRLLAIAEAAEGMCADDIEIELSCPEIAKDSVSNCASGSCDSSSDDFAGNGIDIEKDIPIRKIEIVSLDGQCFTPDKKEIKVKTIIHPANASFKDISFIAVNDYAVKSNLAEIVPENKTENVDIDGAKEDNKILGATLLAKGDGAFRLRCIAKNGTNVAKCISVLEFTAEEIGTAYHNPYDFVAGSLYSDSKGDVGNGNEKGFATPRGMDCYVGFEGIDFGDFGSDEITLPVFALDAKEYKIGIWEGRPGDEGSTHLCDALYCKPSIWNVYQPETYKLNKRLKGVTSLYFTANDKVHIKGFSFTLQDKATSQVGAMECSRVYGDTFTKAADAITGIGNNVTIEFDDMNFGENSPSKLTICGSSMLPNNSIHLMVTDEKGDRRSLIEFAGTQGEYAEQTFDVEGIKGKCKIGFVFLPGCCFDFKWFKFS